METITIHIFQDDVYNEVAKATDYTGTKLIGADATARDRILIADADLATLGRFWDESVLAVNENLKSMLVYGATRTGDNKQPAPHYEAEIEVSKSFDKTLTDTVESTVRSFFIASIIAQWFKFANKDEAKDYFAQAGEMMGSAERLLYSRRKPILPSD